RSSLALSKSLQGMLAGNGAVLRGARGIARELEVHRDDTGQLATAVGVDLEYRLGRELVQRAAILLEESAVRGVLHEPVAEEVLEPGLHHAAGDQHTDHSLDEAPIALRLGQDESRGRRRQ